DPVLHLLGQGYIHRRHDRLHSKIIWQRLAIIVNTALHSDVATSTRPVAYCRTGGDMGMGKGRLEAFSDGVLAVIITIMVLELHPPNRPTCRLCSSGCRRFSATC